MKIEITKKEANVIQVARDHMYDVQTDVLACALRNHDNIQTRESYYVLRMISDIQTEISLQFECGSTI
jgi:hypothetical protein